MIPGPCLADEQRSGFVFFFSARASNFLNFHVRRGVMGIGWEILYFMGLCEEL